MEALRSRRSLLILTFLLGWQFCDPIVAVSQQSNVVVGVSGLGVKDPESKPGLPVDLDLAPPFVLVFVEPYNGLEPVILARSPEEVPATSVLRTTGVRPAAP